MRTYIFTGNLGQDCQVADLQNGKQVINFNVATTEKYGETEKTTWHKCAWFTNNVSLSPYLLKGSKVAIRGKVDVETYQANDGATKSILKVFVDELELISTTKPREEINTYQTPQNNNSDEDDGDLPF